MRNRLALPSIVRNGAHMDGLGWKKVNKPGFGLRRPNYIAKNTRASISCRRRPTEEAQSVENAWAQQVNRKIIPRPYVVNLTTVYLLIRALDPTHRDYLRLLIASPLAMLIDSDQDLHSGCLKTRNHIMNGLVCFLGQRGNSG
ncbi:hypothetical protein MIND_01111100 [Mycena indigotica]|uniref:Uncharacterized protein n=1 Tax=Mycena indigotica TaxID=2126181 RepID=A0A8H6SCB0_9AGAR|nr:uncharacterized protein MIND_01111100 [Mycena indigotica]KAF7295707.1 hypothetical protein MIND_01111100 [Mycena indigotica]